MNQKHLKHLKHFGVLPMSYEEEDTCISYVYVHMRRRIQTPETFRSPSRSLTRILKSHSPSAFIRYTQWKEAFSEFLYESPCPYSWRRVSLFRTWNYASAPTCLGFCLFYLLDTPSEKRHFQNFVRESFPLIEYPCFEHEITPALPPV